MSNPQEKSSPTYDPFESFRTMRDKYLDAMAKTMVEAVNTEAYAEATGTMLETCLTAAAPFREALDKSMLQALQQLSLPSRQELAALAERFTNVEMRLDDMDAKLDAIHKKIAPDGSAPGEPPGSRAGVAAAPETVRRTSETAAVSRSRARRTPIRRRVRRTQR